ncbi:MAG: GNAT family N-acetyltransferase [Nocardioides sp.]
MPDLQFFHPASVDEAIDLLATSPLPVDSPTQRRIRTDDNLREYFASGRRRPEWVWAVRYDDDPKPLGVVGAFGSPAGKPFILDVFGLPSDPEVARELIRLASREAVAGGAEEVEIFAPTGATLGSTSLARLVDPLRDAGWRLLVERRHYEFEPPRGLAEEERTTLSFDRLDDPDDPRLAACHREVMRNTLDAYDRSVVDRLGFDEACHESLAFLLGEAPVAAVHLANDPAGRVVGLVSGLLRPHGRGVVMFVGVAHDHRGRGYGRQLLAWQTRQLVDSGATVLIADTDNTNLPMARAFADVGWPQTESRIDLVPV